MGYGQNRTNNKNKMDALAIRRALDLTGIDFCTVIRRLGLAKNRSWNFCEYASIAKEARRRRYIK